MLSLVRAFNGAPVLPLCRSDRASVRSTLFVSERSLARRSGLLSVLLRGGSLAELGAVVCVVTCGLSRRADTAVYVPRGISEATGEPDATSVQ